MTQCMAKKHTYALRWLDKGRFVSGHVPNVLSSQLVTLSNWQILHILQMELNQVASALLWTIGFCVNSWMPLGITPLLNHSSLSRISYRHLSSASFEFQLSIILTHYHPTACYPFFGSIHIPLDITTRSSCQCIHHIRVIHTLLPFRIYYRHSFIIHSRTDTFFIYRLILSHRTCSLASHCLLPFFSCPSIFH